MNPVRNRLVMIIEEFRITEPVGIILGIAHADHAAARHFHVFRTVRLYQRRVIYELSRAPVDMRITLAVGSELHGVFIIADIVRLPENAPLSDVQFHVVFQHDVGCNIRSFAVQTDNAAARRRNPVDRRLNGIRIVGKTVAFRTEFRACHGDGASRQIEAIFCIQKIAPIIDLSSFRHFNTILTADKINNEIGVHKRFRFVIKEGNARKRKLSVFSDPARFLHGDRLQIRDRFVRLMRIYRIKFQLPVRVSAKILLSDKPFHRERFHPFRADGGHLARIFPDRIVFLKGNSVYGNDTGTRHIREGQTETAHPGIPFSIIGKIRFYEG